MHSDDGPPTRTGSNGRILMKTAAATILALGIGACYAQQPVLWPLFRSLFRHR
jgi:hypothetical protein